MRLIRWMNGVSSKPFVVTNATLHPVRSIRAFVPDGRPVRERLELGRRDAALVERVDDRLAGRGWRRGRLQRLDPPGRGVEDDHVGERPARVDADDEAHR